MNALNKWWIAALALAAFLALAYTSEPYGHGYSKKERADMDKLLDRVLAPEMSASNASKIVYLFGEK